MGDIEIVRAAALTMKQQREAMAQWMKNRSKYESATDRPIEAAEFILATILKQNRTKYEKEEAKK